MKAITEVPKPEEIEHFAWVEPWLARSAQPKPAGYTWLAEHDFDLIVNLRLHDESKAVQKYADRLEPVNIPIKNNCAPTFEHAMRWLAICKANHSHRILVHCNVGEGKAFGFQPNGEHKEQALFLAEFCSSVMSGVIEIPRLT